MFDDWPNWLAATVGAALSGSGVLLAGLLKAQVDNKRVRVDDRADFTKTILERLASVEQAATDERRYCEERLNAQAAAFEERLKARDRVILDLRNRINHLEARHDNSVDR